MRKFLVVAAAAMMVALPLTVSAQTKQGGEMIVTYKDDVSTLDPAIGYDWQNWSIIKSIFSGLMDYAPGTTELVPDLAESYEISEDGLVYTFKLRDGVKFHNGRELVAGDIKYSIERTVNPETQSPGQGFFASIEGFDAMASGEASELSGIAAPDDDTVVFTLSAPNATFLHILAINFSFAVPKEAIDEHGADFATHPVGTGAFSLAEWTLGQRLVFERNPDYHHAGLPYLDRITFEVGQEPTVALLRLQRGEVDVLGDGIPPAQFEEVMNDPANEGLIVEGGQLHTGYVTMNGNVAPFDNVLVRRAVNMAINKDRVVRIINNRAVPANQPLPPLMPGYDHEYAGYAYDPEGAKALLAEAGLADGFDTELYVMNTDPNPRIAQAIQQDLAAIGIRAELQSLAQSTVIAAGGEPDQAAMIWSGGMAWIADFPDASNFYTAILGCAGAVEGGWNWSWYCNEDLDKRAAEANAMTAASQADARYAAWGAIFTDLMKDAPWAPLFNEKAYIIRSKRIDGPAGVFADPIHIPINYDAVYSTEVQ